MYPVWPRYHLQPWYYTNVLIDSITTILPSLKFPSPVYIARHDGSWCIEITLFILFNVVNTVLLLVINAVYDFIYYIDLVIVLVLFSTAYPFHFEQDVHA